MEINKNGGILQYLPSFSKFSIFQYETKEYYSWAFGGAVGVTLDRIIKAFTGDKVVGELKELNKTLNEKITANMKDIKELNTEMKNLKEAVNDMVLSEIKEVSKSVDHLAKMLLNAEDKGGK